jgi:hypothetical protein
MLEDKYNKDENDLEDFQEFEEFYGFDVEEDEEPKELEFGEKIIDLDENLLEDEREESEL